MRIYSPALGVIKILSDLAAALWYLNLQSMKSICHNYDADLLGQSRGRGIHKYSIYTLDLWLYTLHLISTFNNCHVQGRVEAKQVEAEHEFNIKPSYRQSQPVSRGQDVAKCVLVCGSRDGGASKPDKIKAQQCRRHLTGIIQICEPSWLRWKRRQNDEQEKWQERERGIEGGGLTGCQSRRMSRARFKWLSACRWEVAAGRHCWVDRVAGTYTFL